MSSAIDEYCLQHDRLARVSRYQKGKTNLDFTEARDSQWQWHHLGHMQSAPRSRQTTTPAPHHSELVQDKGPLNGRVLTSTTP